MKKDNEVTTTCQVCGKPVKANTGLIANHGYKRPYKAGWQSDSCDGARYVPYEVSCDRLRVVVEWQRNFIVSQEKDLAEWVAAPPQTITVWERQGSYGKGKENKYTRPDDFDHDSYRSRIPRTYECAHDNKKRGYEQTIRVATADLSVMEKRLSEWKPASQVV